MSLMPELGGKPRWAAWAAGAATVLLVVAAVVEFGSRPQAPSGRQDASPLLSAPSVSLAPAPREAAPAPIPGAALTENGSLDLAGMLGLLAADVPKPFAKKFTTEFMKEPALREEWARQTAPQPAPAPGSASSSGAPPDRSARAVIGALRQHAEFRTMIARFAGDPGFRTAAAALSRHPRVASLLSEALDRRPGRAALAGRYPGAESGVPGRAAASAKGARPAAAGVFGPAVGGGGGRAAHRVSERLGGVPGGGPARNVSDSVKESVFPKLTTAERARMEQSCWQDDRPMDFWQCCAAAAIGRCDELCKGADCGGAAAGASSAGSGGGGRAAAPAAAANRPEPGAPAQEPFDWALHNQRRHEYAAKGDRLGALRESDIILAHSLMDDYVVGILAEWHIGKDSAAAIGSLTSVERDIWRAQSELVHVDAAVSLELGVLHAATGKVRSAEKYFRYVLSLAGDSLEGYRALARSREADLKLGVTDFDWTLHNERRHALAVSGNAAGAIEECDVILEHSVMDEYILNILSGWQIGKDREIAIQNMFSHFPGNMRLVYYRAAAKLKAGDLLAEAGDSVEAEQMFRSVERMRQPDPQSGRPVPEAYIQLAQARLANLRLPGGGVQCHTLPAGGCSEGCRLGMPPCFAGMRCVQSLRCLPVDGAPVCPPGSTWGPRPCPAGRVCAQDMICRETAEFDWALDNELRHQAASRGDAAASAAHSDRILRFSPMDGYILAIMSGWKLDNDRRQAIDNLLREADHQPALPFYSAAALVKAGLMLEEAGENERAASAYERATGLKTRDAAGEAALEAYRRLARAGLSRARPAR